jgi:hypothetical protein
VLIAKLTAPRIQLNQNSIVNSFNGAENPCLLIVKLSDRGLFQHVLRDGRVMSIARHFDPEENLDQRVCEPDSNRVDENVTRERNHRFETSDLESYQLHQHREPWVVMWLHPFVGLKLYKLYLVFVCNFNIESVLYKAEYVRFALGRA